MALQGQVDKAASNDKALTGVGVILFFPVFFALGGDQQQEAEYGRLNGESEALQQSSRSALVPCLLVQLLPP